MFTDIQTYKIDLKKYYEDISKIGNDEESEKQKKEIDSKFKDKVRKYLPTCLNIINTNFNCKFTIYKEGKDYNAAMKMVDTKVKKTKEEVESELNNYYSMMGNNVNPNEKPNLDLAIEILKVYVDDEYYNNVSQSRYLNEAINMQVEQSEYVSEDPVPNNLIPRETEIQYNPYAGQPIDYNNSNNTKSDVINSSTFGMNVQSTPTTNNNRYMSDKEFANSDVIDGSSLSIFNNPNGSNK